MEIARQDAASNRLRILAPGRFRTACALAILLGELSVRPRRALVGGTVGGDLLLPGTSEEIGGRLLVGHAAAVGASAAAGTNRH